MFLNFKKISGIPLKSGFLTPSEIVQKFLIKIFLMLPEPENPTFKSILALEIFLTSQKILINFKDSQNTLDTKKTIEGKRTT